MEDVGDVAVGQTDEGRSVRTRHVFLNRPKTIVRKVATPFAAVVKYKGLSLAYKLTSYSRYLILLTTFADFYSPKMVRGGPAYRRTKKTKIFAITKVR